MFTIDSSAVVPIKPRGFGGQVTVFVKPCTVEEYGALSILPEVPIAKDSKSKVVEELGKHIDHISGLQYKRGEEIVQIKTVEDAMMCPPWVLSQLYAAVLLASKLDGEQLGKYEQHSSGGASTRGSTASSVDYEE